MPRYDLPTVQQPTQVFTCHNAGQRVCAGWTGCHDTDNLLALRIAAITETMSPQALQAVIDYVSPVPLFSSGAEAAAHGMVDIHAPGPRARHAIAKLLRRAERS